MGEDNKTIESDNQTMETSNMSDPETVENGSVKEVVLTVDRSMKRRVLILELNVPFSDFTGVQELAEMVRDYRKGGVNVYLANVSPGLKLALENIARHNLIKAFCDSEDGDTQLKALHDNFLCDNVQAALLKANEL